MFRPLNLFSTIKQQFIMTPTQQDLIDLHVLLERLREDVKVLKDNV